MKRGINISQLYPSILRVVPVSASCHNCHEKWAESIDIHIKYNDEVPAFYEIEYEFCTSCININSDEIIRIRALIENAINNHTEVKNDV